MPVRLKKKAREGNTCEIEFTLVGNDGITVIPVGNITTATLTLRNKSDGTIINSRDEFDVESKIDEVGKFFMVLAAEDNPIVSSSNLLAEEIHIATIKVVANNGVDDIVLVQNIWITVENLKFVPSS